VLLDKLGLCYTLSSTFTPNNPFELQPMPSWGYSQ
jgi:hypothetical protein